MDTEKKAGIWMDHSNADVIDLNAKTNSHEINSRFSIAVKEEALSRSESLMHNKEQQLHQSYYKKIGEEILKYDHVLLFGPTHAKTELYNYIKKDLHFKDIQIDVEPTDNMSDNEKTEFVRNHFED